MKKVICIDASYNHKQVENFGYVVPIELGETYFVRSEILIRGILSYRLDGIVNRNFYGTSIELGYKSNRFIECSNIDESEMIAIKTEALCN